MSTPASKPARPLTGWLVFFLALGCALGMGLLLASVLERRQEAMQPDPKQPVGATQADNAKWRANAPREYDSWKKTQESDSHTAFGGAFPRDLLAEDPWNVILFGGYAFAKDYRQARGHAMAVGDISDTKRLWKKNDKGEDVVFQPATCWTCKSPDVPRLMAELGEGKAGAAATFEEKVRAGAGDFYKAKFTDFKGKVTHPIGCLDCHDPENFQLRITRPGLIEAFERQGKDIHKATHQEMRSLVCAQCHVEYYFKGDGKYLTFPWDKGMGVEQIIAYYDASGFKDWDHAISKTPMIKMQHPDFEVYSKGVHGFQNVACADCHMPYKTEGASKFTDHHVQSPLLNVANSCQVCHRWSEGEVIQRVNEIQRNNFEGRLRAEEALAKAHFDICACMQAGASDAELKPLRAKVRESQARWDFVAANNGMGFHAPQECMRILAASVDIAQQARVGAAKLLAAKGFAGEVAYPDVSSKEKAQAVLKLFLEKQAPDMLGGWKPSASHPAK